MVGISFCQWSTRRVVSTGDVHRNGNELSTLAEYRLQSTSPTCLIPAAPRKWSVRCVNCDSHVLFHWYQSYLYLICRRHFSDLMLPSECACICIKCKHREMKRCRRFWMTGFYIISIHFTEWTSATEMRMSIYIVFMISPMKGICCYSDATTNNNNTSVSIVYTNRYNQYTCIIHKTLQQTTQYKSKKYE